jgi:hypothetical protein
VEDACSPFFIVAETVNARDAAEKDRPEAR